MACLCPASESGGLGNEACDKTHNVSALEREHPAALQSTIYSYQYLCIRVHLQNRINAAGKAPPPTPLSSL